MSDHGTTKYTVNLPKTDFPMRASLPQNEPKWIDRWNDEGLYNKLMQRKSPQGTFILHCGPPYANGNLHMGHLLSYVLKDFVVRSKSLEGYRTPFVPGWDCHGLPIEWKIEQDLHQKGRTKGELSIPQLRQLCRDYARKWVKTQKAEWQRFGVIADLEHPYLTMNRANEADIVATLGQLASKGLVYRALRPVHWSTVEQTALAEAEIEYEDHTSTAIYVAFELAGYPREYLVIWTTTPWTLPANRAIAYGADLNYQAVKTSDGRTYWVAKERLEDFITLCRLEDITLGKVMQGAFFEKASALHPFYPTRHVPVIEGPHVTADQGTGFVHTAPAHGEEDFAIGVEHGLPLTCPVGPDGSYDASVDDDADQLKLAGRDIWDAQGDIIAALEMSGHLLRAHSYSHSYPISWRSKAPLIYRTTPQWFLRLDDPACDIRKMALSAIDNDVKWIPGYGRNRIRGMVEKRPDWCLSRQRAWGVPLTIFVDRRTDQPLVDPEAFKAISTQIEKNGIDAWNTMEPAELLEGYAFDGNPNTDLEKVTDILDVWFDSGTTWQHVLGARPDLKRDDDPIPADLYLEGSDQHRGWFHTSLLTSVALTGKAPYHQVLTHGFVVDGDGRKMSKSLGNVVAPQDMLEQYGMDILRLWVASSDYAEDVRFSETIMQNVVDVYRRLRNTFRFLLGNLHDFDETRDIVAVGDLPELEQWVLSRFSRLLEQARADYSAYQFHKVFSALHNFATAELSGLYFDVRKDSLYCDATNAPRRRACQTVLHHLLNGFATHLAPFIPFTVDEVWHSAHGNEVDSIHLSRFYEGEAAWQDPELETRWTHVLAVRDKANRLLEAARLEKTINANMEADLSMALDAATLAATKGVDWCALLMVAEVRLDTGVQDKVVRTKASKCPRCRTHTPDVGVNTSHPELCRRCAGVEEQLATAAA